MKVLTGLSKIYNAVKYDFPIRECLTSCFDGDTGVDEFILVVCTDSEDNTVEFCNQLQQEFGPRLRLIYDKWITDRNEGHWNMTRLIKVGIDACETRWFWKVDIDEVMLPGEATKLRNFVANAPNDLGCVMLKFIHLYGDLKTKILGKLYNEMTRCARKDYGWVPIEDAHGLTHGTGRTELVDIWMHHYGMVREADVMLDKELNFQQSLYAVVNSMFPDYRLVEYSKAEKLPPKLEYYARFMGEHDQLLPYDGPHHPLILKRYGVS